MYEFDTTPEQAWSAAAAAAEFRDYVVELVESRRRSPRDDLVTALAEAEVDGGRLSDDEIVSTVVVLLNAGHEATVNTLGTATRMFSNESASLSGMLICIGSSDMYAYSWITGHTNAPPPEIVRAVPVPPTLPEMTSTRLAGQRL